MQLGVDGVKVVLGRVVFAHCHRDRNDRALVLRSSMEIDTEPLPLGAAH